MEYRILGKTGLKVSAVGMGTLGFARAGLFNKGEEGIREMARITNRALDLGLNFIDTAYAYGRGAAERGVGEVMKTRRSETVLLGRTHVWQQSLDPKDTQTCLEESLKRLQTDTIDVYQLHDVTSAETYDKVLSAGLYEVLKDAKRAGKVRFIGYSTHGNFDLLRRMIESGEVDVLTVAWNALNQKRQIGDGEDLRETSAKVFPLAAAHGIGITIMKPLGGGVLTWQGPAGKRLPPAKLVRYVVQNQYVHTVTPGVDNIAQLEELAQAGDPRFALSAEEIKQFEEDARAWGLDVCRQCGYCLPCSQEIHIPTVMRILMQWHNTKDKNLAATYRGLQHNASECIECGECEDRCPYELPIAQKMREAEELFGKNVQ